MSFLDRRIGRRCFLKEMAALEAGVALASVPVLGQQWSELMAPRSFAGASPEEPNLFLLAEELAVIVPISDSLLGPDFGYEDQRAIVS